MTYPEDWSENPLAELSEVHSLDLVFMWMTSVVNPDNDTIE